jgi:hypothetical protein
MTEKQCPEFTIESNATGLFILIDGCRLARLGQPGTPQPG